MTDSSFPYSSSGGVRTGHGRELALSLFESLLTDCSQCQEISFGSNSPSETPDRQAAQSLFRTGAMTFTVARHVDFVVNPATILDRIEDTLTPDLLEKMRRDSGPTAKEVDALFVAQHAKGQRLVRAKASLELLLERLEATRQELSRPEIVIDSYLDDLSLATTGITEVLALVDRAIGQFSKLGETPADVFKEVVAGGRSDNTDERLAAAIANFNEIFRQPGQAVTSISEIDESLQQYSVPRALLVWPLSVLSNLGDGELTLSLRKDLVRFVARSIDVMTERVNDPVAGIGAPSVVTVHRMVELYSLLNNNKASNEELSQCVDEIVGELRAFFEGRQTSFNGFVVVTGGPHPEVAEFSRSSRLSTPGRGESSPAPG